MPVPRVPVKQDCPEHIKIRIYCPITLQIPNLLEPKREYKKRIPENSVKKQEPAIVEDAATIQERLQLLIGECVECWDYVLNTYVTPRTPPRPPNGDDVLW